MDGHVCKEQLRIIERYVGRLEIEKQLHDADLLSCSWIEAMNMAAVTLRTGFRSGILRSFCVTDN